jgi:hypothetical protein
MTSEYSQSEEEEEEEESDRGRALPKRWEPVPPSPRAAEAAVEQALGASTGAPTASQSVREVARIAEVPVHAAEAAGGVAVVMSAAATAPVEPPRKRKRGFSTLR